MLKENDILVCSNARSLIAYKDEIAIQLFKEMDPLVVALTETRITEVVEDKEISITGYTAVRCDSETRNTGGVILYIKDTINYKIFFTRKQTSNYWCIAIWMNDRKHYKDSIAVVYHSPSASDAEFVQFIIELGEELNIMGECIITGDFNIDMRSGGFYAQKLVKELSALGIKQFVNDATRITKNSQTVIDLVFSNNRQNVRVQHTPIITNHAWVMVLFKKYERCIRQNEFKARDRSKFSADYFEMVWKSRR